MMSNKPQNKVVRSICNVDEREVKVYSTLEPQHYIRQLGPQPSCGRKLPQQAGGNEHSLQRRSRNDDRERYRLQERRSTNIPHGLGLHLQGNAKGDGQSNPQRYGHNHGTYLTTKVPGTRSESGTEAARHEQDRTIRKLVHGPAPQHRLVRDGIQVAILP